MTNELYKSGELLKAGSLPLLARDSLTPYDIRDSLQAGLVEYIRRVREDVLPRILEDYPQQAVQTEREAMQQAKALIDKRNLALGKDEDFQVLKNMLIRLGGGFEYPPLEDQYMVSLEQSLGDRSRSGVQPYTYRLELWSRSEEKWVHVTRVVDLQDTFNHGFRVECRFPDGEPGGKELKWNVLGENIRVEPIR